MPIGSIDSQPAANSLNAAYRPIIFTLTATATGGGIPPVVFCDVYFNDVYYKTFSKSQYKTPTTWEFDIQDAVQEYLEKYLEENGQSLVLDVAAVLAKTQCRFRSSGFDVDGFIQPEDISPVQGTLDVAPVPGTGTASNIFYSLNATLQHEDNQNLAMHLASYRNGTWAAGTYPLTHRPNGYKMCVDNSDSFPIVSDDTPVTLVLHHKLRDEAYDSGNVLIPCVPASFNGLPNLPDASTDVAYSYLITLSGTGPFTLGSVVKPAWMTISVTDNVINFSGTPDGGDIATGVAVSFNVLSCTSDILPFADALDVILTAVCTPASTVGFSNLPDAQAGVAYSVSVVLAGTAPFTLSGIVKPSWMNIAVVGSNVEFTGTPANTDAGTNITVDVTVNNCVSDSIRIFNTIAVTPAGKQVMFIRMTPISGTIKIKDNITGLITDWPASNASQSIYLASPGIFTLQQISAGNSDLRCYTTWGGSVIQLFDEASQGDVLAISDLANTNFIGFYD